MYTKVNSLGLFGLNAFHVDVEIDISKGTPTFDVVGLPDLVVKESRERIRSALRSCGIAMPVARITVNLAPADTKKSGSVYDLAILIAILKAMDCIHTNIDDSSFIGEVSLNGDVRAINGVLPMVLLAKQNGIKAVYVPYDNAYEASVVDEIEVYGVKTVTEIIDHLSGISQIQKQDKYIVPHTNYYSELDFADVKGQPIAKHALEIAAAEDIMLCLSALQEAENMLAKRMPSILPTMTFEESISTTNIHSISGLLNKETPLITVRPFRSLITLFLPQDCWWRKYSPSGEISLAHNGLLFLDELPEFDRRTLEILRQPLEDQEVTISRVSGTITYPASIMLIAAMNPCPCGYYGHPKRKCVCNPKQVSSYLSKVSGPLLDRLDLHIEVAPVEFEHIASKAKEESSEVVRQRVQAARKIQAERFKGTEITCNARITPNKLQEFCPMDDSALSLIKDVFDKMGLSARAYDRI